MTERKLTPKQTRFAEEYLVDLNATQAAIRAGFSKATARQKGHQLLKHPAIWAEIAARRAEIARTTEVTQEAVLTKLEEAFQAAMKDKQYSAAVRAAELQGKHIGIFIDRTQLEHAGRMSDEMLAASIAGDDAELQRRLVAKLGGTAADAGAGDQQPDPPKPAPVGARPRLRAV
jgi:hypothetical protein